MKEEMLWGLLNFHWFLAASISLASSWVTPETSHVRSPLDNVIAAAKWDFFPFSEEFHPFQVQEVLLFPLCLYTFSYIHKHFSVLCLSFPIALRALQHRLPHILGMSLLPGTKESTQLASLGVTAMDTTQRHRDAEVQALSFRGEPFKGTENTVAFQLLGNQYIFSLI